MPEYSIFSLDDFSGGLNTLNDFSGIANNESPDIKNMSLDEFGILLKRSGTRSLNVPTDLGTASHIVGLHKFYQSDGSSYFLVVGKDTDAGKDYLWKLVGSTWSKADAAHAGWTNSDTYNFLDYGDNCYIANGIDDLAYFDGSTITSVSSGTSPSSWDFATAAQYSVSDSTKIEVSGGAATLVSPYDTGDNNYVETNLKLDTVTLLSMTITESEPVNTEATYQISTDNGETWYYHNGGGWLYVLNNSVPTRLESGTSTNTTTNLSNLTYNRGLQVKMRTFLYTSDGASTPTVSNIEVTHKPNGISKPLYMIEFKNRIFYVSNDYPNVMFISEAYKPTVIDIFSWIVVKSLGGDTIQGLAAINDIVCIFTKLKTFIFFGSGSIDTWILKEMPPPIGCKDNKTIVNTENELMFLSDKGIYGFNGQDFRKISTKVNRTIEDILESDDLCATYKDNQYHLNYYSNDNAEYRTLLYHYEFNVFVEYSGWKANTFFFDTMSNTLYFGRKDIAVVMEAEYQTVDQTQVLTTSTEVYDDEEFTSLDIYDGTKYYAVVADTQSSGAWQNSSIDADTDYTGYSIEFYEPSNDEINLSIIVQDVVDTAPADSIRYFVCASRLTGISAEETTFTDEADFTLSDDTKIGVVSNKLSLKASGTYPTTVQYCVLDTAINFQQLRTSGIGLTSSSDGTDTHIYIALSPDDGTTWYNLDFTTGLWQTGDATDGTIDNVTEISTDILLDNFNGAIGSLRAGTNAFPKWQGYGDTASSNNQLTFCLVLKTGDNSVTPTVENLTMQIYGDIDDSDAGADKAYKYKLHSPIEAYWSSKLLDFDRMDLTKRCRMMFIDMKGDRGSLKVQYKIDDETEWNDLLDFALTGGAIWGSFTWGETDWNAQGVYQLKAIFPSTKNKGRRLQFRIFNNNASNFRVYGMLLKFIFAHAGNLSPVASASSTV